MSDKQTPAMIIANPAQLFSFLANEKNKFPLTAIKGSVARGFQLDETELFPYLIKFQQWLLEFNEHERERAAATLHPSESAGVKGAVWVKASDRLPEDSKLVFIKIDNTIMIVGRYIGKRAFGGNEFNAYFTDFNGGKLNDVSFNQIQWLDETATAAQGKEDAVAFMNWTLESECEYSCTDEDQWTNINDPSDSITTSQLYDIYKQPK